MRQRLCMSKVSQCSVILNNLRPYIVGSAHFPNALPMQRLDNLCVAHQSQVTRRGLSYKAFFFSSVTNYGDTFHFAKRFMVVWEEWPDAGLFDKNPASPPPEIQDSTSPPSASGGSIEAGVFNTSNWGKYIDLVSNWVHEVDYDM